MDSQVLSKKVRAVYSEKQVEGALQVAYFTRRGKIRRASRTAAICVGIVLVCACIPGAHFVLVPLALLASPFMVIRSYKVATSIVKADVSCAACGQPLAVLSSQERYPMYETCRSCQRENRLFAAET